MKWIPYIIIAVLLCLVFRQCNHSAVSTERYVDTVIVQETVRDTILIPQRVYIARVDTVFLPSAGDTVYSEVVVPIERKEYRTDDYFAVVEGFRPRLLEMEIYPQTKYITRTEVNTIKKKPRIGVGIQAGYGYNGQRIAPYIGVGVQYNIFTL